MRRELVNLGWFIAAVSFGAGIASLLWMIGELT